MLIMLDYNPSDAIKPLNPAFLNAVTRAGWITIRELGPNYGLGQLKKPTKAFNKYFHMDCPKSEIAQLTNWVSQNKSHFLWLYEFVKEALLVLELDDFIIDYERKIIGLDAIPTTFFVKPRRRFYPFVYSKPYRFINQRDDDITVNRKVWTAITGNDYYPLILKEQLADAPFFIVTSRYGSRLEQNLGGYESFTLDWVTLLATGKTKVFAGRGYEEITWNNLSYRHIRYTHS